mgnify:FL=1
MSHEQDVIHAITLTRIGFYNMAGMLDLLRRAGSATAIMEHSADIRQLVPDASPRLVEAFSNSGDAAHRAEVEYAWAVEHGVRVLCYGSSDYPQRLNDCPDAPLVLYYKGNADLNQQHVINIVGTRRCTVYGQDIIRRFVADLRQLCPRVLIVSGLAYGVDICAHRQALQQGFETVGVLAHGLDDLYPTAHRDTAVQMLHQGGLVTEFMTQTRADKMNFVRRNRIVAGMADATLLIQSAAKGGGLITCDIAQNYGRDVFAFPGPVDVEECRGCNNLIRDNGAGLITSAEDFVNAVNWNDHRLLEATRMGIERQLFPDLSAEEQTIVDVLCATNDLQVNLLTVKTGIPISRLSALLFTLEMKGVVRSLAGGMYHLLK